MYALNSHPVLLSTLLYLAVSLVTAAFRPIEFSTGEPSRADRLSARLAVLFTSPITFPFVLFALLMGLPYPPYICDLVGLQKEAVNVMDRGMTKYRWLKRWFGD